MKRFLDADGARYLVQKVREIISNKTLAFSEIEDKPTTIAGYGIVDAIAADDLENYVQANDLDEYATIAQLEAAIKALTPTTYEAATQEDVAEAFNNITTEEPVTVKIANDLTVSGQNLAIAEGADVTLEVAKGTTLNLGDSGIPIRGKLTIAGEGTITATGAGSTVTLLATGQDAEIVVESGKIVNTGNSAIEVQRGATITVNGGEIQGQEFGILPRYSGSTVNINGGTIKTVDNVAVGNNGTLDANRGDHGGTIINITGGRLESHITTPGYVACGVYMANHGICNISGGEIVAIGGCGVCLRAGTVNITGGTISGSGDASLLGKVGDSRVVVGPNGIVYDQSAKYPGMSVDAEDNGIHLNIYGGTITGKNSSIQVLKTDDFTEDINVYGGLLVPSYE